MSQVEALRTENDALHIEIQQLKADNRRLRQDHRGQEDVADEIASLRMVNSRLIKLYERAQQMETEKSHEHQVKIITLRAECTQLEVIYESMHKDVELERYRAIEAE